MTSLPLSIGVPGEGPREREQQRPRGGLALNALAGDRVAEERDVERCVDLGLACLPIETAIEGKQLVERRELDLRGGEDREVGERRRAARRDEPAGPEGLARPDRRASDAPAQRGGG